MTNIKTPSNQLDRTTTTSTKKLKSSTASTTLSTLDSMQIVGGRTGTDKIYHHGYHRFYPFFLESLRIKNLVNIIPFIIINFMPLIVYTSRC